MEISKLQQDAYETARKQGRFSGETNFPGYLAMVHSELSEALECHRRGMRPEPELLRSTEGKPIGIPFELADVVIRVASMSQHYQLGLEAALQNLLWSAEKPEGKTIGEIPEACNEWALEKGLIRNDHGFEAMVAMAHQSVSDALRKSGNGDRIETNKASISMSMAGVVAVVYAIAHRYRIDLNRAIAEKTAYNDTRATSCKMY